MARIDVCIEEYLDEVCDSDLIEEIEGRGYRVTPFAKNNDKHRNQGSEAVFQLKDIREILGVKKWQGTDRLKESLSELIDFVGG